MSLQTRAIVAAIAIATACGFLAVPSHADTITVNGKTYTDVLVYSSSQYYYVRLPEQGKVINVDKGDVDPSSVQINEDPYYRDKLKQKYREAKEREEQATRRNAVNPSDPAFQVKVPSQENSDLSGFQPGSGGAAGAGGGGLGVQKQQIRGILQTAGFQFQQQGDALVGTGRDGTSKITLRGQGNSVSSITVNAEGPQQQMIGGLQQMGILLNMSAPGASQWLQANSQKLMQGGSISTTQGGAQISITTEKSGDQMSIEINIQGA